MSTVRVSPRAEEVHAEVVVGIKPLSFDDLVAVARHGAPVRISEHALSEVRRTRAVVDALAADDQPHYGISTGFFDRGELIEFGETERLFTNPAQERTEAYITGRFG